MSDEEQAAWPTVHIWRDLGYVLRSRLKPGGHWLDFELLELSCHDLPDDEPLSFMCSDERCITTTEDIDRAEAVVDGFVKWDGCSEFATIGNHHQCSRDSVTRFAAALGRIYDVAAELMPEHAKEYLR